MPNPDAAQQDGDALSRPESGRAAPCGPAAKVRLIDICYRTMTAEEDRAAVAAVAALVSALLRAGHRPPAPTSSEGDRA